MKDRITGLRVTVLCCLFLFLGTLVLHYPGVQNDEALFAVPIYQNLYGFYIPALHQSLPLMVTSYVGAFKTFLYLPIFDIFGVSALTLRLPMLLAGALTIYLFFKLAMKTAGYAAALPATVLLATDVTFLLTDTFDWGPVAIEHLFLVTGCLQVVRFAEIETSAHPPFSVDSASRFPAAFHLGLGFFLFGVAFWNKAVFVWAFTGLVAATLAVLWPEVRKRLNSRNLAVAAAGLLLGALPVIVFNIKRHDVTLRSTAHLENTGWIPKLQQLRYALDGSSLFGFITAEEPAGHPDSPASSQASPPAAPETSRQGRIAAWVVQHLGEPLGSHRGGGMAWACGLSLLLVPLWWRSLAARFAVVYCAVTWVMMAVTQNAGTAAHHSVLLWPFPQLLMGITLAALPWRRAAMIATLLLALMNLLVFNQYLFQFDQYGTGPIWTDAMRPLSSFLDRSSARASKIYIVDWGLYNSLTLLHEGKLPLVNLEDSFRSDPAARLPDWSGIFADSRALYVGHVAGQELIPGCRERLEQAARTSGFQKQLVEIIPDSHDRPMFEVFRLIPR